MCRLEVTVAAGLLALSSTSCEPLADGLDEPRAPAPIFERSETVAPAAAPRSLRVMTWNVKFGAGRIDFFFDGWGDRVQMTSREVRGNLDALEALVREIDPDVLLTNEIEVNSRRSAYVDMVTDVLEHTHLNYAAYYQSWNSRYVASEGFGRVDMGNAIFSKYPITFAERVRQVDRGDQDPVTKAFYHRNVIGRAHLKVGSRDLAVLVTHVAAYDTDGTKQKHLKQLAEVAAEESLPLLLGGDFNELPPTAAKISEFADEHPSLKGTEFEQPPYTPEAMRPFFDRYRSAITLDRIGATEETQRRFYSHSIRSPANGGFWTRTLDYLFLGNGGEWENDSTDVLQSPGRLGIQSDPNQLSDHAPVVGTWVLP